MRVHEWTRVETGIFNDFHVAAGNALAEMPLRGGALSTHRSLERASYRVRAEFRPRLQDCRQRYTLNG